MKTLKNLLIFCGGIAVAIAASALAQQATQPTLNPFKVSGTIIQPNVPTNSFRLPSLGGAGIKCLQTDNDGDFSTSTNPCGTGGGSATTTITVGGVTLTGPNFIVATSGQSGITFTGSGVTLTVAMPTSTSLQNGYLSSDDWTTFSNKLSAAVTSLNGSTNASQTFATSTDTNLRLTISTAAGVHTFTPVWNGTLADGRIASAATWNAKESALTFADGLTRTTNTIDFTCTEVEGTGINCNANDITLDATGDWTGTIDGNNFAGGAVAQGDLLYGSGAGTITELTKDANATRYLSNQGASNNPSWNQVNLANGVTGVLPIANGGTGTSTAPAVTGQLLMANGATWMVGNLVAGTNVTLTTSTPGQITINSTGGGGAGVESGWRTTSPNVYLATSTDRVGVGTTTPAVAFVVASSSGPLAFSVDPTAGQNFIFQVQDSGGTSILSISSSSVSAFETGKVGIGTTNPGKKLTVKNDDIYVASTTQSGVILTSPNGTCHRVVVSDANTVSASTVTCPAN